MFAEKFSTPIDPLAIVAPVITVLPLTNTSTAFPFQPSPNESNMLKVWMHWLNENETEEITRETISRYFFFITC